MSENLRHGHRWARHTDQRGKGTHWCVDGCDVHHEEPCEQHPDTTDMQTIQVFAEGAPVTQEELAMLLAQQPRPHG